MSESVYESILLAAAALNALGLPLLLGLLWRLNDLKAKAAEQRSYRATWDQVDAIEKLLTWHGERVQAEQRALEERLREIQQLCIQHDHGGQMEILRHAQEKHGNLSFWLGSALGKRLNRDVVGLLASAGPFEETGAWRPLGHYEELLGEALAAKRSNPTLKSDAEDGAA